MRSMQLADINAMTRADFVATFADVAEHSPWVAEAAYSHTPFESAADLIEAFEAGMRGADRDLQLSLIRAHPDLAGKAARAGTMAEASKSEQAGAGLDTLSDEEFERFTALNDAYKAKFGFPFIFAVKGATKHMILGAFEERLENDAAKEFETALTQIARIFRFRLEDLVSA